MSNQAIEHPTAAGSGAEHAPRLIARPDLLFVVLHGADVLTYLHKVSSQHVIDAEPGDVAEALLLSPKGRIEHAFRLTVLTGAADPAGLRVLVDTAAARMEALCERLARLVFRYDVSVGAPARGCSSLVGRTAEALIARAGVTSRSVEGGELALYRTPIGFDLVGPGAGAAAEVLLDAGAGRADLQDYEALRVAAGIPMLGGELTDDVLAEEAGLLGSHVHLDKGCYPGQETVARVHNLGQVQRRLAGVRFGSFEELPPPGSPLTTPDGRRAGQIRTVARHGDLGGIALAYVRRTVADGDQVMADGHIAEVAGLPLSSTA